MVLQPIKCKEYEQLARQAGEEESLFKETSLMSFSTLDRLDNTLNMNGSSQNNSSIVESEAELEARFKTFTDQELQKDLKRHLQTANLLKQRNLPPEKWNVQILRLQREIKRREESKQWLNRAKMNQAEAHGDSGSAPVENQTDVPEDDMFQRKDRQKSVFAIKASRGAQSVAQVQGSSRNRPNSRTTSRGNRQLALQPTTTWEQPQPTNCSVCKLVFNPEELAPSKVKDSSEADLICVACWPVFNPDTNFPSQKKRTEGYTTIGLTAPRLKQSTLHDNAATTRITAPAQRPLRTRKTAAVEGRTKETAVELLDSEDEADTQANKGPTPRRSNRNSKTLLGHDLRDYRALFPALGGKDAVEVCGVDLIRLDPMEFLNDTCIDFYIRYLKQRFSDPQVGKPEVLQRCHFFNSFFYKKLSSATKKDRSHNFEYVKKWTKGVDIFEKDFLFVPIHDHLHWSLAIICNPGRELDNNPETIPAILHLDSLTKAGGHDTTPIAGHLLAYLKLEWDDKAKHNPGSFPSNWQTQHPQQTREFNESTVAINRVNSVPRQGNHCDCGLFLLTFIEFFAADLPNEIYKTANSKPNKPNVDVAGITSRQQFPNFLTRDWFSPDNGSNLRGFIRYLMLNEFIQQAPDRNAQAIAVAVANRNKYLEDVADKYKPPEEWREDVIRKKQREEEAKRRKQEAAALKRQAQRDKAAAAAEPTNLASPPGHDIAVVLGEYSNDTEDSGAGEKFELVRTNKLAREGAEEGQDLAFTRDRPNRGSNSRVVFESKSDDEEAAAPAATNADDTTAGPSGQNHTGGLLQLDGDADPHAGFIPLGEEDLEAQVGPATQPPSEEDKESAGVRSDCDDDAVDDDDFGIAVSLNATRAAGPSPISGKCWAVEFVDNAGKVVHHKELPQLDAAEEYRAKANRAFGKNAECGSHGDVPSSDDFCVPGVRGLQRTSRSQGTTPPSAMHHVEDLTQDDDDEQPSTRGPQQPPPPLDVKASAALLHEGDIAAETDLMAVETGAPQPAASMGALRLVSDEIEMRDILRDTGWTGQGSDTEHTKGEEGLELQFEGNEGQAGDVPTKRSQDGGQHSSLPAPRTTPSPDENLAPSAATTGRQPQPSASSGKQFLHTLPAANAAPTDSKRNKRFKLIGQGQKGTCQVEIKQKEGAVDVGTAPVLNPSEASPIEKVERQMTGLQIDLTIDGDDAHRQKPTKNEVPSETSGPEKNRRSKHREDPLQLQQLEQQGQDQLPTAANGDAYVFDDTPEDMQSPSDKKQGATKKRARNKTTNATQKESKHPRTRADAGR